MDKKFKLFDDDYSLGEKKGTVLRFGEVGDLGGLISLFSSV